MQKVKSVKRNAKRETKNMKRILRCFVYFTFCISLFALLGCATSSKKPVTAAGETQDEVITALESVTGAIATPGGEPIEAKELIKELRKDPQAQSAMRAIAEGYSSEKRIIRYCPETGEHFGPNVKFCPGTQIPLVEIEE